MTSASGTPDSLGTTTALLKTELPRLESHQQSLEKELAAVTERLESVRSALTALVALSDAPHVLEQAASVAAAVADEVPEAEHTAEQSSPAQAEEPSAPARRKARKAATGAKGAVKAEAKKETAKRPAAKKSSTPKSAKAAVAEKAEKPAKASAAQDKGASGLTEQVVEILANAAGDSVRARDVAAALGRDDSPGNINAVRSTLDRLVATSRADRAGRGLYRARS